MSKKTNFNPVTAALGTTFAISLATSPIVNAAGNPFSMTDHGSGYMIAEGKCGEGKCGDAVETGDDSAKDSEGKCGEGKCGDAMETADDSGDSAKGSEGKCGEGKCGDNQ